MILDEGKRDNQLTPYLDYYNQKTGKNISLGEFKSMMLKKLSFEGGMRNISLQSNYYLVGAIRYYFEGLLTTNKELSIFNEGTTDEWNVPVCQSLNALILVLRNSYIDTVGTTWEQPEDFGSMQLLDLFKKYNKEIKKVLKAPSTVLDDTVTYDYAMNNDKYDYDIIYNFSDSSKYENATSPGSWCITYGMGHLNSYMSAGHGHFIVFKQKGYEKIPRVPQREKWINGARNLPKPQDDYGNSLIAYLQSNSNPGPADYDGAPLITSRWNHGSEFPVEADRAYTQEEFERITGVTMKDLEGIYKTWKANAPERSANNAKAKASVDDIRKLKYIQMRINGGENPSSLLEDYHEILWNTPYIKTNDNRKLRFIMCGKKIFFETATFGDLSQSTRHNSLSLSMNVGLTFFNNGRLNLIIGHDRTRSLIKVGDKFIFKAARIPDNVNTYMAVRQTHLDNALIDVKTGKALMLPNGNYWFNKLRAYNISCYDRHKLCGYIVPKVENCIVEITYDISSGEKYFLDTGSGKFINFNTSEGVNKNIELYRGFSTQTDIYPMIVGKNEQQILYKDGQPYECQFKLRNTKCKIGDYGDPNDLKIPFSSVHELVPGFLRLTIENYTGRGYRFSYVLLDLERMEIVKLPNGEEYWEYDQNTSYSYHSSCDMYDINGTVVALPETPKTNKESGEHYCYFLYNTERREFYENPLNYPSKYLFSCGFNLWPNTYAGKYVKIFNSKLRTRQECNSYEEYATQHKENSYYFNVEDERLYKRRDSNDGHSYEYYLCDATPEPALSSVLSEAIMINEGKRDNQLIPYIEAYNEATGKNVSVGEFKSMMLRKLSFEGGMTNLSLQSNYYLVGAIKYYFSGELTNSNNLSVYSTEDNATDDWNEKNCKRLNILVLLFRNSYIDSIGTAWLEPEDFGNMTLDDLCKKYNTEIKKALAKLNKTGEKEVTEKFVLNGSETIGNGYTADIIYTFNDSQHYKDATTPGAWCITYGKGHLDYYTSHGHGHFIIFRKQGYESVPRVAQKEKWIGLKPQDDYGNSLIAYLQSNSNPGPADYDGAPLITSRWNHGSEFSVEADRAYTQKEFEQITGVTLKDLTDIFNEWKQFKDIKTKATKVKVDNEEVLRKVKYIQMRINGGEDPNNFIRKEDRWELGDLPKNGVCVGCLKDYDACKFLIDGRKIILDTVVVTDSFSKQKFYNDSRNSMSHKFFSVNVKNQEFMLIYSERRHTLCKVGDVYFFKGVPKYYGSMSDDSMLVVKTRFTEGAILDFKTDRAIPLPNGQYWFNEFYQTYHNEYRSNKIESYVIDNKNTCEIVYDSSSREKYFFEPSTKTFFTIPMLKKDGVNFEPYLCHDCSTKDFKAIIFTSPAFPSYYMHQLRSGGLNYWNGREINRDYYTCQYYNSNGQKVDMSFDLTYNNEKIHLDPETNLKFDRYYTVLDYYRNIVAIGVKSEEAADSYHDKKPSFVCDLTRKIYVINPYTGEPLIFQSKALVDQSVIKVECDNSEVKDVVCYPEVNRYFDNYMLFNYETFEVIKNPFYYPDENQFSILWVTTKLDSFNYEIASKRDGLVKYNDYSVRNHVFDTNECFYVDTKAAIVKFDLNDLPEFENQSTTTTNSDGTVTTSVPKN